jgi:hypothetical protein
MHALVLELALELKMQDFNQGLRSIKKGATPLGPAPFFSKPFMFYSIKSFRANTRMPRKNSLWYT